MQKVFSRLSSKLIYKSFCEIYGFCLINLLTFVERCFAGFLLDNEKCQTWPKTCSGSSTREDFTACAVFVVETFQTIRIFFSPNKVKRNKVWKLEIFSSPPFRKAQPLSPFTRFSIKLTKLNIHSNLPHFWRAKAFDFTAFRYSPPITNELLD